MSSLLTGIVDQSHTMSLFHKSGRDLNSGALAILNCAQRDISPDIFRFSDRSRCLSPGSLPFTQACAISLRSLEFQVLGNCDTVKWTDIR